MQASLSKLFNKFDLVILQELFKALLLALPAVFVVCDFAPKLWIPPLDKFQQKLTLQS
jgi:hypothetical protein